MRFPAQETTMLNLRPAHNNYIFLYNKLLNAIICTYHGMGRLFKMSNIQLQ